MKLLGNYSQQRADGDLVVTIDMVWKYYLLRSELLAILNKKLGADVHHLALTGATSEDLLNHIGDERYIVDFFLMIIEKMMATEDTTVLDEHLLDVLLNQTGQQMHYLKTKEAHLLDAYDVSNLKSILRKAGWMRKVYGVFDSDTHPNDESETSTVYYDTHSEALFEVSRRVNEEEISESNLKVMSKELIIPIV